MFRSPLSHPARLTDIFSHSPGRTHYARRYRVPARCVFLRFLFLYPNRLTGRVMRLSTAAVSIYMILAAEFLLRYRFDKPFHKKGGVLPKSFQLDNGVKLMIVGLAFDGVFILIRYVS